jgi:hypothetical protein
MTTMLCFRICLVLLLLKVDYICVDVVGLLLNSRKMRLRQVGATTSCISTQNQVEPGWRNHHASLPLKLVSVVFEVQVGHGRAVLPSGYSTKSRLLCGAQQDS